MYLFLFGLVVTFCHFLILTPPLFPQADWNRRLENSGWVGRVDCTVFEQGKEKIIGEKYLDAIRRTKQYWPSEASEHS